MLSIDHNKIQKLWKNERKLYADPEKLELNIEGDWLKLSSPKYKKFVRLDLNRINENDIEPALNYLWRINNTVFESSLK